ncbi:hypothetical protein OIU91_42155 (plasmid) [Streptomyces sp. NBC_01456]|uniref:hypothetical protein n=1 Tax=unclassified Streptomyces TaxID=2593676 RepID=UPI002E3165C1|nr:MULTISPECIES: hypothetical protein [unclassified Streptomyces]
MNLRLWPAAKRSAVALEEGQRILIGPVTLGKANLPPDSDVRLFVNQLKRALHTIECRELGSAATEVRFGPFADTYEGHRVLWIEADRLLAQYPAHEELHELLRAVRERGPAVNVTLSYPQRGAPNDRRAPR